MLDRICDRIEEYHEGQLTGEDRIEFENHLGSCPSCREELDWMRSLDLMFEKAPVRRPPRSLERRVLAALGFGVRPVWATTFGWAAACLVGAWLIALPSLIRITGPKSIAPVARGLADLPSFLSGLLHGLRAFVDLLKPVGITAEALVKALGHTYFSLFIVVVLTIGFMAGLGIWHTLRGVRYVRVHA
jgi:hypothetical protein